MRYEAASLHAVKKQLPTPALDLFVDAANEAAQAGCDHNDCIRFAWAKVREGWVRRPDRQWARIRKGDVEGHPFHGNQYTGGGGSARQDGESDKAYAKRVVDQRPMPKALPEDHDLYFTRDDGTQTVSTADLVSTKSDAENVEGGTNGAKRMGAAARGELSKRPPITVRAREDGKYDVVDGNGTLTSVRRYGWKALPVNVVKGNPTPGDVHVPVPIGVVRPKPPKRKRDGDEVAKSNSTLYVNRPLLNGDDIREWAASQGIESTLTADDMHVTIAFSKAKVDWDEFEKQTDEVTVGGGERKVHQFPARTTDNGALVLLFEAPALEERWAEFKSAGASWDHDEYRPHITITYSVAEANVSDIEPYDGPLVFGPEEWSEVKEDWANEIKEEPVEKKLGPGATVEDYIHDFVHSSDKRFAGKSKEERIRMALGAWYETNKALMLEHVKNGTYAEFYKAGARHSRSDQDAIQNAHDAIVRAGATCGGEQEPTAKTITKATVMKLDKEQRIVWGWASVITVKGEPVMDAHQDIIEPRTMEIAANEFMKSVRVGALMHKYDWTVDGDELVRKAVKRSDVIHSLPLSYELASALGIHTEMEGWIIGKYVADDNVWASYEDGTHKAFSIGGSSEFHPLAA